MADAPADQSQRFMMWFFVILAVVFVCLEIGRAVNILSGPVGNDPANPAIRESALLFSVWALWGSLTFPFTNFRTALRDRLARFCTRFFWPAACVLCLLHIAVAFHLGHAWSHQNAWEHTRAVSGFGEGVYVNYAFALVWLFDAIWLCVAFDSYFARPRWLHWTILGFLAFVAFNATVVFASWKLRRWVLFLLALVLAGWYAARVQARKMVESAAPTSPNAGEITDIDAK